MHRRVEGAADAIHPREQQGNPNSAAKKTNRTGLIPPDFTVLDGCSENSTMRGSTKTRKIIGGTARMAYTALSAARHLVLHGGAQRGRPRGPAAARMEVSRGSQFQADPHCNLANSAPVRVAVCRREAIPPPPPSAGQIPGAAAAGRPRRGTSPAESRAPPARPPARGRR